MIKKMSSITEQSVILFPRFTTPHHREGFELFLDTIVAMEDVWLVSAFFVFNTFSKIRAAVTIPKWINFQKSSKCPFSSVAASLRYLESSG